MKRLLFFSGFVSVLMVLGCAAPPEGSRPPATSTASVAHIGTAGTCEVYRVTHFDREIGGSSVIVVQGPDCRVVRR